MSEEEFILTNCSIYFKIELKTINKFYDEWINNNSSALASLRIDRIFIINVINKCDDKNKHKMSLQERKELALNKNLEDKINFLANEKQQLICLVQTVQQLIKNKK